MDRSRWQGMWWRSTFRMLTGVISLLTAGPIVAQTPGPATLPAAEKPKEEESKKPFTPEQFSFHFQATATPQAYPGFHADYSGRNSLPRAGEGRTSYSSTLYLGARLWHGGEAYANPEIFGGRPVGENVGAAGFPNGDANRVSTSHPELYLARAFVRQTFGLGGETENLTADQNQLASTVDISRLTFTFGKFSATDILDNNSYSHDPRTQFMNWSMFETAAWDYPADIRGYSIGGVTELNQPKWALRYGIFMEPGVASGPHLDYHIGTAFGQSAEMEQRYTIAQQPGKVRVLAFLNRADMGDYNGATALPSRDITRTRHDSLKYGIGLNFEQQITDDLGLFARFGWNDGWREDWSFTEIDRSASVGLSLKGTRWHRPEDTFGLAGAIEGLSAVHRRYLEAGGVGFIIGDGRLRYDAEQVVETYYSAKVLKYFYLSGDVQWINHPAYNRDRGPVILAGLRLHLQV